MSLSLNDKHIVIHYHYIENPSPENSGMNPCPISEFEKHIKFLSENYTPASIEDTFAAAKNNSGERYYSITFDDGLRDQYQNAVPILKKYNARATFFIITKTLEGVLPAAHKFHVILSHISSLEAIGTWNLFVKKTYPEHAEAFFILKDQRMVKNRRLYADIPTANIKEMFTAVPTNIRDVFLDFIFKKYGLDEASMCSKIFMNPEEIKDLSRKGFEIGTHTHTHEPIETLGEKGFHEDFKTTKKWLAKTTGKEPVLFSYPYGIVPPWGSSAVAKEGITHAVTVEERALSTNDNPLLIPRYDMATLRNFLAK